MTDSHRFNRTKSNEVRYLLVNATTRKDAENVIGKALLTF